MVLAGPRVGEITALRWRAVDLARGRLTVEESKTDAGEGRVIDLSPMLLDELKAHKASARYAAASDLVFPTSRGTPLHRANISNRLLARAVEWANEKRVKDGRPPIQGVTNHTLRRTFASLLYEAGASPAYVMDQLGPLVIGLFTQALHHAVSPGFGRSCCPPLPTCADEPTNADS
jgi:integrase